MTEELVMQIEPIENIEALRIYEAKADGLLGRATIPPITVLLRDFGGMGQIIVECDGSAWSRVVHDHLGGLPPRVDLEAEMALGRVLLALSEAEGPGGESLVRAAHDCSTGGLIQTLVDSCLRCGVGASVDLTAIQGEGVDDFAALFSESGARAIVAVREELVPAVTAAAEAEDVAVARLGTTGGDLLVVAGSDLLSDGGAGRPLVLDLAELGADVEGVLPALF